MSIRTSVIRSDEKVAPFERERCIGVTLSFATTCKIQYPVWTSLLTGALAVAPSPWLPPQVWSAGPASRGIFQSVDTVMTNPPAGENSEWARRHLFTWFPWRCTWSFTCDAGLTDFLLQPQPGSKKLCFYLVIWCNINRIKHCDWQLSPTLDWTGRCTGGNLIPWLCLLRRLWLQMRTAAQDGSGRMLDIPTFVQWEEMATRHPSLLHGLQLTSLMLVAQKPSELTVFQLEDRIIITTSAVSIHPDSNFKKYSGIYSDYSPPNLHILLYFN